MMMSNESLPSPNTPKLMTVGGVAQWLDRRYWPANFPYPAL